MNKYCKYILEEAKSHKFSHSVISFIHDSETFKENNTVFKPKIDTELNLGGADRKFQKKFIFLKMDG